MGGNIQRIVALSLTLLRKQKNYQLDQGKTNKQTKNMERERMISPTLGKFLLCNNNKRTNAILIIIYSYNLPFTNYL